MNFNDAFTKVVSEPVLKATTYFFMLLEIKDIRRDVKRLSEVLRK